jgi:imidazolonepropionase-like amidohydrolase
VQLWSQTRVGHTPTLVAAMGGLPGDQYWYQHTDVWHQPLLRKYVPPGFLRQRAIRATLAHDGDQNLLLAARIETQLHSAGVRVFLGAHGMREGLAVHWEMWSLALGGMKPIDVLRAATVDSARQLGMEADLGSLARGKLADFIVLDADPLADIRNTQRIRHVVANGRLYDAATMNEIGGKERLPLFWER